MKLIMIQNVLTYMGQEQIMNHKISEYNANVGSYMRVQYYYNLCNMIINKLLKYLSNNCQRPVYKCDVNRLNSLFKGVMFLAGGGGDSIRYTTY